MGRLATYDRAGAEAGLGRRLRVHRVVRYIGSKGALWCISLPGAVVFLASGESLTAIAVFAVVAVIGALVYKAIPPSTGVQAIVLYEGGLGLAEGRVRFVPLPWEALESCEFIPEKSTTRGTVTQIRFSRFLIHQRKAQYPIVVTRLMRAQRLLTDVRTALASLQLTRLHDELAARGRVVFDGNIGVTREGLLFDAVERHSASPLPWSQVEQVWCPPGPVPVLAVRTAVELIPGRRAIHVPVHEPWLVEAFIRQVRAAAPAAAPPPASDP